MQLSGRVTECYRVNGGKDEKQGIKSSNIRKGKVSKKKGGASKEKDERCL